jgi:integrase
MRDIHKLLLLLGQRTQDVCSMQISEIDTDRKEWTVPAPPRGKNKQPNTLPLPPLAWDIIKPRLTTEKWIFPSNYNSTRRGYTGEDHAKSTKNARKKLTKLTGVKDWTGHDLRRTLRTLLSREGVQPHIAERVLGHVQSGVEGIYDRYAYLEEKGQALLKMEKAVRRIVGL